MLFKRIVVGVVGAVLVSAGHAGAEPQISNVDTDPANGGLVTVTGTGFGVKGSPGPVIWSNFEEGEDGVTDINGWGSYVIGSGGPNEPPIYTNELPRGVQSMSVRTRMWGSGFGNHTGSQGGCRITKFDFPDTTDFEDYDFSTGYLSFWAANDTLLEGGYESIGSSVKLIQWYGSQCPSEIASVLGPPKLKSNYTQRVGCEPGGSGEFGIYDYGETETSTMEAGYSGDPWHYGEGYQRYESMHVNYGDDNTNSWAQIDINGVQWGRGDGAFTGEDTFDGTKQHRNYQRFTLFHYANFLMTCGDGRTSQITHNFGEIYADTVLARIEIGNASSFVACTHREIQIPVDWSGESVSFVVNQGEFSVGESAWVYVIDRNGQPNQTGRQVVFQASGDSPTAPLNAAINRITP